MPAGGSTIVMKVIIDFSAPYWPKHPRQPSDQRDWRRVPLPLPIRNAQATRVYASGPDARHIIQRRGTNCLGPFGAVRADRKAVHLVAHPLDEIEHRIIVPQRHDGLCRCGGIPLCPRRGLRPWPRRPSGHRSRPRSSIISRTALTCPCPPSISNRSGHVPWCDLGLLSASVENGGSAPLSSCQNHRRGSGLRP